MFAKIFAHFPFKRMIKGAKSGTVKSAYYQPDWDSMYEQGEWDYLTKIDELGHYSLLVGYCQYLNPKGNILDIGCGEGLLQQRLSYLPYQSYVGVDVSSAAIAKVKERGNTRNTFIVADASQYKPSQAMDIIFFNECLYYFEKPHSVLVHYSRYLSNDGYFVISMFDQPESDLCWQILEANYKVIDAVSITNQAGLTWNCKVATHH